MACEGGAVSTIHKLLGAGADDAHPVVVKFKVFAVMQLTGDKQTVSDCSFLRLRTTCRDIWRGLMRQEENRFHSFEVKQGLEGLEMLFEFGDGYPSSDEEEELTTIRRAMSVAQARRVTWGDLWSHRRRNK